VTGTTEGEERARQLEATIQPLLARAEQLKGDLLYRAPTERDWSVMQILAHVAEILPYWAHQARDVAARTENNLPFGRTAEDPDRIAAVEEHAHDALDVTLRRIREGLAETVAVLRAIPAEGWQKTARHERRGEMSVARAVDDFLLAHAKEHAAQVEQVLNSVGAS
jgi:uncharacterized damage-inducible protein DinB